MEENKQAIVDDMKLWATQLLKPMQTSYFPRALSLG
jgi:hypothetical protein